MTGAEPPPWRLLNPQRLLDSLAGERPTVVQAIKAAIEELLDDPLNPVSGFPVYPLRGRASRESGMLVARLPSNYTLTFVLHPHGLPPLGGRYLTVYALVRELTGDGPSPVPEEP